MSDFEEREYWVKHQQRFEAALRFATTKVEYPDHYGGSWNYPDAAKAVEMADELLAKLEETRK